MDSKLKMVDSLLLLRQYSVSQIMHSDSILVAFASTWYHPH